MIKTELSADLVSIEKALGNLKNKAPNALKNAINRTIVNVNKNMAAGASKEYYIKSSDVKKTLTVSKATKSKLVGTVSSKSRLIPLSKFKVTPNRKVSYSNGRPTPKVYKASVKRGGSTKKLDKSPKAFIAVMKSGHTGVFERTSANSFPIRQLFGPSVPQMIGNDDVIMKIQREANVTLKKRIEAEVNYILEKG